MEITITIIYNHINLNRVQVHISRCLFDEGSHQGLVGGQLGATKLLGPAHVLVEPRIHEMGEPGDLALDLKQQQQ